MKQNPYSNLDPLAHRIAYLIAGYIRHTLTEPEHDELDDWVNESDHNMQLFEDLTDEKNLEANLKWMDGVNAEKTYQQLQQSEAFKKKHRGLILNTTWIAAASVIIVAGSLLFFFYNNRNKAAEPASPANTLAAVPKDSAAGILLTLANGKVIDLSSATDGVVDTENGLTVSKEGGEVLSYSNTGPTDGNALHILTVPRGKQFQLKLPDGTRVWLNAGTTLRYPPQFAKEERKVRLTGEAYFEVTKNAGAPFHVSLDDDAEITVTGTHFNVMAYDNAADKEVTLLEGAVTVSDNGNRKMLEPGTRAIISKQGIEKQQGVDVEEAIGWKSGLFVFRDASIELIAQEIERWYNVPVVLQGKNTKQFNATISRAEPLAKLLHLLELNGNVHFKTENNIIYVLP